MDKYNEALNNISNYEIWHWSTYDDDDGYCNDDGWTEYPFSDSEDINLLSELITKHNILNKGIDEIIEKYNEMYIESNKEYLMICIINDLKKLKGE